MTRRESRRPASSSAAAPMHAVPAAPPVSLVPPARARVPAARRPRLPRAGAGAPAVTAPAQRRGHFPLLTLWFGFGTVSRVFELLARPRPGFAEAMFRAVELGSAGAAAALTVALWRGDRWVARAAAVWAATVVARRALEAIGPGGGLTWLVAGSAIPIATAAYIHARAEKLGLLA